MHPETRKAAIARLRPYTPATSRIGKLYAKRCAFCGRNALKANGYVWCQRHQPGHARDRKPRRNANREEHAARMRLILRETGAERVVGVLAHWEPIAAIIAHRPRQTRPVLLGDVVSALVSLAAGDHAPWSDVCRRMRDAGLMLPGQTSLSEFMALSLGKSLVYG